MRRGVFSRMIYRSIARYIPDRDTCLRKVNTVSPGLRSRSCSSASACCALVACVILCFLLLLRLGCTACALRVRLVDTPVGVAVECPIDAFVGGVGTLYTPRWPSNHLLALVVRGFQHRHLVPPFDRYTVAPLPTNVNT